MTVITHTAVRLLAPAIWLVAAGLLWRGHNAPGGGFVGALVAGAALALGDLTDQGREPPRLHGATFVAAGMLVAVGTAAAPLAFGRALLEAVPLDVGPVHLTTTLFFDVGVALIVLGLVRTLLTDLAAARRPGVIP